VLHCVRGFKENCESNAERGTRKTGISPPGFLVGEGARRLETFGKGSQARMGSFGNLFFFGDLDGRNGKKSTGLGVWPGRASLHTRSCLAIASIFPFALLSLVLYIMGVNAMGLPIRTRLMKVSLKLVIEILLSAPVSMR